MPRLAEDFRVIAVDPRGVGVSDTPDHPVPLPEAVVDFYVQTLARSADALRASFEFYRAIDEIIAQNERRRAYPLAMPVLTLAGEQSLGARVGEIGQIIATDPVNVVIGNCGHYLPEEQPEALLAELIPFLEPYRAG
jgi:pimeloyl-ACP methyl ester carboxylesterase